MFSLWFGYSVAPSGTRSHLLYSIQARLPTDRCFLLYLFLNEIFLSQVKEYCGMCPCKIFETEVTQLRRVSESKTRTCVTSLGLFIIASQFMTDRKFESSQKHFKTYALVLKIVHRPNCKRNESKGYSMFILGNLKCNPIRKDIYYSVVLSVVTCETVVATNSR